MPSAEVTNQWIAALVTLAGGVGLWIIVWVGNYIRTRAIERLKTERSPEVAGAAIGAAFPTIDRTSTQALLDILETLKKVYKLLVDRQVHEAEVEAEHEAQRRIDEMVAEAERKLQEKFKRIETPHA